MIYINLYKGNTRKAEIFMVPHEVQQSDLPPGVGRGARFVQRQRDYIRSEMI